MSRPRKAIGSRTSGQGYSLDDIASAKLQEEFLNKFDGDIIVPNNLNEEEKEIFLFLAKELMDINLFKNCDGLVLAQYVKLYTQYLEALETLEEEGQFVEYTNKAGETNIVESASSKLVRALIKDMATIGKKFPFSPIDRLQFRDLNGDKEKSLTELLMEEDED